MERPIAVVTGASSGLGAELATLLAQQGWNLVLINRTKHKTRAVIDRISAIDPATDVDVFEADLADQDSVHHAATAVASAHPHIMALFNNAGVLLGDLMYSKHHNEMHFQVNTLAPYMLMQLLRGSLRGNDRAVIVNVSSGASALTGRLRIDELRHPPAMRKLIGPYAQSKLALTTLTNALAADYRADGISLRSMDPGGTKTKMTAGTGMPAILLLARNVFFQSVTAGATMIYDVACHPRFDNQTGIFVSGGNVKSAPKDANNTQKQLALLRLCQELTGV